MSAGKGGQSIGPMMNMLGGGQSGPPGTAQEPWNPAARLAQGFSMPGAQPQPQQQLPPGVGFRGVQVAPGVFQKQPPQSFGQQLGNAVIPNTMGTMSGKGGGVG